MNGVPQQFLDCAIQIQEVDQYKATRPGPGTVRDPLDAACPSDDASDELSDCDHNEHTANAADGAVAASAAQLSTESQDVDHFNRFETPVGMGPTAVAFFVQHVAAFKHNLEQLWEFVSSGQVLSEQRGDDSTSSAAQLASLATAKSAAEEHCF